MAKKPGLKTAYGLDGVEDVKALYRDWAESYDDGFAEARGYDLHRIVAEGYHAAGGEGPVLDVGAGTGLVGEVLAKLGIGPVDGTDISPEMLEVAAAKGCYARTFVADITQPTAVFDDTYCGIVSAGTFTLGHLGPGPIAELIRITRPGGLVALTINAQHWEEAGFESAIRQLGDLVADVQRRSVQIYAASADHDHAADIGYLTLLRVL
ncbi:MAG: class I SAM-dependent methyltransferase [Pseudomonadota bacterium]